MEKVRLAKRAVPQHLDVPLWDTCFEKMLVIRGRKIDTPGVLPELLSDFFTNFVATSADARPDGGPDSIHVAPPQSSHLLQSLRHDPRRCSTPTSMDGRDDASIYVYQ